MNDEIAKILLSQGIDGLTKREIFAAMALSGICSSNTGKCKNGEKCAKLAVIHADALIAELNKEKKR